MTSVGTQRGEETYATFASVPARSGHPIGWIPPALWPQLIALLRRNAGFPASIRTTDLYTNQFVDSDG